MITRPQVASYDPFPSSDQLGKRQQYKKTVDAVAISNSNETRAVLRRQDEKNRYDDTVNIFGENIATSTWKSIPVNQTKNTSNKQNSQHFPEQEERYDDDVKLDHHEKEAHARHNSLMCDIDRLRLLNNKHAEKTTRTTKSHEEALKIQDKAHATPLDKRLAALESSSNSMFNEEKQGHETFVEKCKWYHRNSTQYTAKSFIGAIATLNQNGSDENDNARMLDMLKHQNQMAELYLMSVIVKDDPETADCMGIKKNTTLPARCKQIVHIAHEVHRTLNSAPGATKHMKLRGIGRIFSIEICNLRDVFNKWDESQVMRFSRLTKSIAVTGTLPFARAPTAAEIESARVHAESLKEEQRTMILSNFHNNNNSQGGRNGDNDDSDEENKFGDDASSVSSEGESSGSESIGTQESRDRLQTEIQRAHHDTPFMAGGQVMYAPRRPHTKGSRALTAMELDAIPLVTGARDSVEHATSLSSPRRKPHPSWEPHVELEAHPTFGNKYHGHHLHVHHHHHGDEWKEKNGHPSHKKVHKHHHHRHSSHGGGRNSGRRHGHARRHPKTLRECILSHETDVSVLFQAYKTEKLNFPPSWKEAAEKAEKEAQQVQVLRDDKKKDESGSHHNVYEIEAHGKPPSTHRVFQELVVTAKKAMNNTTLKHFKANSYKKVLALNLQQRATSSKRAKRRLDNAAEAETAKHAHLVVTGRRSVARQRMMEKLREEEEMERIRPGRRPTTSFSQAVRIPGFSDIQMAAAKRERQTAHKDKIKGVRTGNESQRSGSAGSASARPASTVPTTSARISGSSGEQRPERPQTSRASSRSSSRASNRHGGVRMSVSVRQREYDLHAQDIMASAKLSSAWNEKTNER